MVSKGYRFLLAIMVFSIALSRSDGLPFATLPAKAQTPDACAAKFPNSLVGYWGFDDPQDPMKPLYGTMRGTIVGSLPLTAGIVGQALAFNGGSYVNYGTALDIPAWENYTVSIWFLNDGRVPPAVSYGQKIIDKTTWFSDFFIGVPNNPNPVTPRPVVFMYDRDFKNIQTTGYDYIDSQWHHALITKTGTHGELWIDGILIGAKDNVNPTINNQPLLMGYSLSGDGYQRLPWGGYLDEFAVFNRALTAVEIQTLYERSRAGEPYCVATDLLIVNSVLDPGDGVCNEIECTLREAITAANAIAGRQTIGFNIPGAGPHTIQPLTALPVITDPVMIDGYTEPGSQPNTKRPGQGVDMILKIELDGRLANTPFAENLVLRTGGSTIRGLAINSFRRDGITIIDGDNNLITGNLIGLTVNGSTCAGNGNSGVRVSGVSSGNLIGGEALDSPNVIACNQGDAGVTIAGVYYEKNGVQLKTGVNYIVANLIGTDLTGLRALGNAEEGIEINTANRTWIMKNIIAGNRQDGIRLLDTVSTMITSNWIGTNAGNIGAIGNGNAGILLFGAVRDTSIGGPRRSDKNVIAYNGGNGILLLVDGLQNAPQRNRVYENTIFANGGLGIDLSPTAHVTPNDPSDSDSGPNGLQNYPVLNYSGGTNGSTVIQGLLNSTPSSTFALDFYSSQQCDPSYYGEGERFLGSITLPSDPEGNVPFSLELPVTTNMYEVITAVATSADRNSSEFSPCLLNSGIVNSSLRQERVTTDSARLAEGIFVIRATFRNRSNFQLRNGFFKVTNLAYRSGELRPASLVVRNAEGGAQGMGAVVALPRQVDSGATTEVTFQIYLPRIEPFNFMVDAYGVVGTSATATEADQGAPFAYAIEELMTNTAHNLYLPLISR